MTCALKNIFGCNAVQRKSVYHKTLSEAIVGLNKIVRSSLVVVDGLVVQGKFTKRLGLVMASENVVAADTAASILLGIKPDSVKCLVLASKERLGDIKFAPKGDYEYFSKNFPKRNMQDKLFERCAAGYLKLLHKG
jgi:uncharacterized protein (DUF362 family)